MLALSKGPRLICRILFIGIVAVTLSGCGDGGTPGGPAPDPNEIATDQLKERLSYIGQTGQTGSALAGMREAIEQTGNKSLMADYQRLQNARRPDEAKRIAQQMAGKL